ncbi:hypothetical protein FRC04_010795 [Tulasnella sp. 424]|nr:hypothetical protein FRC04_010795 [Tulasnella sp. 424]
MNPLPTTQQVALAAGASVALYWLWNYYSSPNQAPYPPGPFPLPLLGNILDMPLDRLPVGFTAFGEKYGPLTFVRVPGSNILVINSYEAATDLLDKRGTRYADRPRMVMMGEMIGGQSTTILGRYGPAWKTQRKLLRQALSADAVRVNYSKMLEKKWLQYLNGLVNEPDKFLSNLTSMVAESVVEFSYGRHTDEVGNDYLERLYRIQEMIVKASFGYVVDLAPFLKHLPSWLPGMKFKRDAAKWKAQVDEARALMFSRAVKDMEELGLDAQPCYTVNALKDLHNRGEEIKGTSEDLEAIDSSGFSFYVAGAETTEVTFRAFLLAMILYPEVQAAAHAEIDKAIGRDRLPTFEDREKTPYLKAMILESLRWSPAGPVGVPHRLMEDDVYNGYFIPKGTTVFPCIWGMTRNPKYFKDPTEFKPERFLTDEPILDPRQFVFGFGRRICPGSELAMQTMWIGMASILWAFEVKPVGEIDPKLWVDTERFTLGNVCIPVPFKCQFIPRFDGALEKISQ